MAEAKRGPRYLATERTTRERLAREHRAEDVRTGVVPLKRMADPYRDPDGRDIDVDDVGRTA